MSSVAGVRKCPGLCSDQSVSLTVTVSLSSISTLVCHLNSQTQTPARTGSDRSVIRSLGSGIDWLQDSPDVWLSFWAGRTPPRSWWIPGRTSTTRRRAGRWCRSPPPGGPGTDAAGAGKQRQSQVLRQAGSPGCVHQTLTGKPGSSLDHHQV